MHVPVPVLRHGVVIIYTESSTLIRFWALIILRPNRSPLVWFSNAVKNKLVCSAETENMTGS